MSSLLRGLEVRAAARVRAKYVVEDTPLDQVATLTLTLALIPFLTLTHAAI